MIMVGVIWFVQIVHYPLFSRVGTEQFGEYLKRHQHLTTFVVGPPMLIEAVTTMLLIWYPPIPDIPLLLICAGLLFLIWMSTAFLQIPSHGDLERGFKAKSHRGLVWGNWIRTLAWTARGGLLFWIGFRAVLMAAN